LTFQLRQLKPQVVKAPFSYLLNERLTGFKDPQIEKLVESSKKHLLLRLAIEEYELMSKLAQQDNLQSPDNRMRQVKLHELHDRRLELERMIISEDPRLFKIGPP